MVEIIRYNRHNARTRIGYTAARSTTMNVPAQFVPGIFDQIRGHMRMSGVTDADLAWYLQVTQLYGIPLVGNHYSAVSDPSWRNRFSAIQAMLRAEIQPVREKYGRVVDWVFPNCICGTTLVGMEQSRWWYVTHQQQCFHLPKTVETLQQILNHPMQPIDCWPAAVIVQLADAGMVYAHQGRLRLQFAGRVLLWLSERATGFAPQRFGGYMLS